MNPVSQEDKGRKLRITDFEGVHFIGTVEYVDNTRGIIGIVGFVEGSSYTNSLQVFVKSEVEKVEFVGNVENSTSTETTKSKQIEEYSINNPLLQARKFNNRVLQNERKFGLGSACETGSDSDHQKPETPAHNINKQTNINISPSCFVRGDDEAGYPCYILPQVVTVSNGLGRTKLGETVRNNIWSDIETPPEFTIPRRLYFVDLLDDLFEEMVERLRKVPRLGLSCEGQLVGREGKLGLLVLSSLQDVVVFDIRQLGLDAFKYGLNTVLSNPDLVKVVHDSRQISDLMYHQLELKLSNVFDTLAGHLVFSNWAVVSERRQRGVKSLSSTVRDYLGVPDEHLFTWRSRPNRLKEDGATWLCRPLPDPLLMAAARNSIYLLPLADMLEKAMELPVLRAGEALMKSAVDATHDVSNQVMLSPHIIPDSLATILPVWKGIIKRYSSRY